MKRGMQLCLLLLLVLLLVEEGLAAPASTATLDAPTLLAVLYF